VTKHLTVRVTPNADVDTVALVDDDTLSITTRKSAEGGAANKAVVELVSNY